MITLKRILEGRALNTCVFPLWKLRIKDGEYEEIKSTLKDACYRGDLFRYEKEAALYYAEWWRREYSGGSPSTEYVVCNLGLSNCYSDDFYKVAKRGAQQLGFKFIQKDGRHYYFRTMLLQGGLPINYIRQNQSGFSGYKQFLIGLVKEVKAIDVDWNNTDFIYTLPCINYLPISFNNEGIFDLSLQIAHAIIEGRDDLLPYDAQDGEWENLTNELKRESSREKHRVPFIVNWELSKKDSLILYYSIDNAKKIDSQTIRKTPLSGCYSFSLYVQDKYVASYRRMNEEMNGEYFYLRIDNHCEIFLWKGESVINIQLKGDNENIADITAPRCFAPDLSFPQVFQKLENKWVLISNRKESTENAILFCEEWRCDDESFSVEKVLLTEKPFSWIEFNNLITLVNTYTTESITFDNKVSTYFFEFLNWTVDWIEDANYKVLINSPEIRVYDSDHEVINKRFYKVFYRKSKTIEWSLFNGFGLPSGLIEFQIQFPDGKYETEKFYFLENLHCNYLNMNSESGEILWDCHQGTIAILKEDGLLYQKKSENHYLIMKERGVNKYPETIQFKIHNDGVHSLNIKVASPFKGITLVNSNGIELNSDEIVAFDSLCRFKIIVVGYEEITTKILYQRTNSHRPESVVIRGHIKRGIHPLSLYGEPIQKMFQLYGFNSFDRSSSVRMCFGDGTAQKQIEIRRFDLDSFLNKDGNIFITNSHPSHSIKEPFNNLISEEKDVLDMEQESLMIKGYSDDICFLPTNVSSNEIEIYKMVKKDGHFSLPEACDFTRLIVFSDYLSEEKIVPKFYDYDVVEDFCPEERHLLRFNDIGRQKKILLHENIYQGDSWKGVLKYFEIIMEQRLPFRTLNCFSAIAQSPLLMVRMLFSLCLSLDKDKWLSGIINFENEFATAYHWINSTIWNEKFGILMDSVPEVLKDEIFKVCAEGQRFVIEETLNTDAIDLIRYALQDGKCRDAPTISRSDVQEMRSKIMGYSGNNTDLPKCQITTTDMFFNLEGANDYQVTCLLSPVKAAESLMGKTDDLWRTDEEVMVMRRIINFYRSYHSDIYNQLLFNIVQKINTQIQE